MLGFRTAILGQIYYKFLFADHPGVIAWVAHIKMPSAASRRPTWRQ